MNHPDQKEQNQLNTATGRVGILLTNLGTPDAPETREVRRYLKEFLGDPRLVDLPRPLWWLILNGVILRTRPSRSAALYRKVWCDDGSPLLSISRRQASALQQALKQETGGDIEVVLAMRYGNPSIREGLNRLRKAGVDRLLVLPLYPQYSSTTTASTFDAVAAVLSSWRRIPELRFVNGYHDHSSYIEALANSVREYWQKHRQPDRLLFSFHGIPKRYADQGDPYGEECKTTARLVAERLGLMDDQWSLSFQSRLGDQEWLTPYTDETLKHWPEQGVKRVHVLCPGFSADCLETLEEIAEENRNYFLSSGGASYSYIPALNDRPDHISGLVELVKNNNWST